VFWAALQFAVMQGTRREIVRLQAQVERAVPAVNGLRESARGRERIAGIREALATSHAERRALGVLLVGIAEAAPPGAQLDSFTVTRVGDGLKTRVFGRASGPSGPAALSAAAGLFRHFQRQPNLKELAFEPSYGREPVDPAVNRAGDDVLFMISFLAPGEGTH
jgi:hypothetical protein